MAFEDIELVRDGAVLIVRLNRPHRLNAISNRMVAELLEVFSDPRATGDARAILLTGAGRGFCAGADLVHGVREANGDAIAKGLADAFNPLILRLNECAIPTVAAVNGPAAGAGVGLALGCDIAIAARSATFTLAFARIGAALDAATSWLVPRMVGKARAYAMGLLAETVDAERAARWGLIWEVSDDDRLLARAAAIARSLAAGPSNTYRLIKQELAASPGATLAQQLEIERRCQAEAFDSADLREGIAAFNQKRAPRFSGS